uniref:Uncharacterized protein n=1 Tax=Serinus canaria TaxID=9135 RepID=A0A8C9L613_SERCA
TNPRLDLEEEPVPGDSGAGKGPRPTSCRWRWLPAGRGTRRHKIHRASVSFCFLVVIEDDRIDDVLQNLSEKAPPGV